jgi:hypothetical protein
MTIIEPATKSRPPARRWTSDEENKLREMEALLSRRRLLVGRCSRPFGLRDIRTSPVTCCAGKVLTFCTHVDRGCCPTYSVLRSPRPFAWFGSLQYRSGLVLTSKFSGFGGLSGLRLDPKGERFICFSDKGTWFTGRIVYQGRQMTGLADVEAAPMASLPLIISRVV